MKIYQLQNHNGNAWANQLGLSFKINGGRFEMLQSYESPVVMIDYTEQHITLGTDWDYSKTTLRAVSKFLADHIGGTWSKKDIERALKDEYITLYDNDGSGRTSGWTFAEGASDFFADFLKTQAEA